MSTLDSPTSPIDKRAPRRADDSDPVIDYDKLKAAAADFERKIDEHVPLDDKQGHNWESCPHDVLEHVRKMVDEVNEKTVAPAYDAAWDAYAQDDDGDARRALIKTVEDCANEFDAAPSCELTISCPVGSDIDADVEALYDLASRHGKSLLDRFESFVQDRGGAFERGPRKLRDRVIEKAKHDYDGDVMRVVDVERATGVFDTVQDFEAALTKIGDLSNKDGSFKVVRCKDTLSDPLAKDNSSRYRDVKINIAVKNAEDVFVGELQLNIRRIVDVKEAVHCVYRVDRAVKGSHHIASVSPGLQSEQVLRLKGDTALDVSMLRTALESVMSSRDCTVANVYIDADDATCANVCLGVRDVGAIAKLRDDVVLDSGTFEGSLNAALNGESRVEVDRGAFMEGYARMMMRFDKLTPHQRKNLKLVQGEDAAVLLAPAGGGKTFVAIQRMLQVLQDDSSATILFVARNEALALFACKWLVVASRKKPEQVVERVHVLVKTFEDGPTHVRVDATSGRPRLVFEGKGADATKYKLIVVDEAHHLVNDMTLQKQLKDINAAASKLLFLGDASQATAMLDPKRIASSLVALPSEKVVVATLTEVVRSTKRIVAGAAAFQLEAGRKAETKTHAASVGPPLVARIFQLAGGDDEGERYAREVVEAFKTVREQLKDLKDLDDRVAVVCPNDEEFVERLRRQLLLESELSGFEIVDAATASAVLPRGETEARAADAKQWLVVDRIANMDGLERLVVICVGLDQVIDYGSDVSRTRSRLYRAMTRAQLAVAVVNKALPGGWLEFLGHVELTDDDGFDEADEKDLKDSKEVDDVVISAQVAQLSETYKGEVAGALIRIGARLGVSLVVVGREFTQDNDDLLHRARQAQKVSQPISTAAAQETMSLSTTKVKQTIWDAKAATTTASQQLRFDPFRHVSGQEATDSAETTQLERDLAQLGIKKSQVKLDDTNEAMTYAASVDHARKNGGRLLTLAQARVFMGGHPDYLGGKPLVQKDMWCAVTRNDRGGRDWVQIGNGSTSKHPTGRSHVDDYGYPGWGDTGHPAFTYVLYVK